MSDSEKPAKGNIDSIRDSAASAQIGIPEEGENTGFIKLSGNRLIILKRRAAYEFIFADQIDPGRTNAGIPNSQQKILNVGSDDIVLGQTLLTANALFKINRLPEDIDCPLTIDISLQLARDLVSMKQDYENFKKRIEIVSESVSSKRLQNGFSIPTIDNLEPWCTAFIQFSHRVIKGILDICRLFYCKKITHADSLLRHVVERHGEDSEFARFLNDVVPYIRFLWNLRNSIEHPKKNEKVIFRNFSLRADGLIDEPSIELMHPISGYGPVAVTLAFKDVVSSLANIFEYIVALLCSVHVKPMGVFKVAIAELPDDERPYHGLRFSYVVQTGDGWTRLG